MRLVMLAATLALVLTSREISGRIVVGTALSLLFLPALSVAWIGRMTASGPRPRQRRNAGSTIYANAAATRTWAQFVWDGANEAIPHGRLAGRDMGTAERLNACKKG
ncbi:hypothetical protein REMIM1_PF00174 (plasmid) [Rhizobium etli bv. mimosae str. Mim1]|nr:hypothetical protein REMIM1_PF00174 [Rhizobium etli bv. mimosae str. Mim1]